jgi:multicomponent Na+:H+ antiporter subunit C
MSQEMLYLVVAAAVFGIGVYGLLLSQHILHKLLALNLMGSGVFLLLVALGSGVEAPDPVPQAMVLTGIVVAVSATAFALALLLRLFEETGSTSVDEAAEGGD